jgi:hypothetical protein
MVITIHCGIDTTCRALVMTKCRLGADHGFLGGGLSPRWMIGFGSFGWRRFGFPLFRDVG